MNDPKVAIPISAPQSAAKPRPTITAQINPSQVYFTPPLVGCLSVISRMQGRPVSTTALEAGLPRTQEGMTPYAVIRAARREGIDAQITHKPAIDKISPLNLPCILLMQDGSACVLVSVASGTARIIMPENPDAPFDTPVEKLRETYTGHAVFARPKASLDGRTEGLKIFNTKQWFWGTIFHFLPIYRHVILATVFINLLAIASPLFTMNVYDRVVPNNALETLWVLAVGVGIAFFFDFALRNLRGYFVDVAGRNSDILVASKLMSHILSIRLDHKPESTGALVNNMREFDSLREFFSSTTLLALVDLPFLILFITIIFYIGGPIAIVPGVVAPIVILVGIIMQGPLKRAIEGGYKESTQKNALLVETVSGLETIKTSRAEGSMLGRWENIVGMGAKSAIRSKSLSTFSLSFTQFASQIVYCGVIIWGVYRISEGEMTMGGLIACSILVGRAMAPLGAVAAMLTRLQQSRMALKNLDLLMQIPSERPDDVQHPEHQDLRATITFEDVSFKYPSALTNALSHIGLHIAQGERVAIIGKMGSGKTTLGKLINGLYEPQKGAVKIGGLDIRQIDPAELRAKIGYMAQDNFLFHGTVRENITLGAPHVSDQALLRAATIAGVTDFIKNNPAGFNLQVGERGLSLSGGQRQAITIARTLLLDPDIVILDEPSSSMDVGVEAVLKLRLSSALKGKTLILITHRPSLLSLATRVIALEGGSIIADGPRNEVLAELQKRGNGAKNAQ
ncbi:type I secretion system permease/ATPase [Desulfomicrobium baculatum]|uniref:Type I secretion system ATPase n=1 Tax=Desulfomicrobium baculatum (strain DSM 4028 / VKM B-1378 / X) TaxID=525897 RepID=C7LRS9_DESBD|nr:type I secretion system permease/ATPase [Desulfomicrobium baculatum]ACU88135.1 type I secretion system ATPase [Desulfomicrobium baculatum DSM 4028]